MVPRRRSEADAPLEIAEAMSGDRPTILTSKPCRYRPSGDGFRRPQVGVPYDLADGANCQVYAYALLAHFGVTFPPMRSSELWTDEDFTDLVETVAPLNLLLFNRTLEPFGAHVALCLGEGLAVHLSKGTGRLAIWSIGSFAKHQDYRVMIGDKRPRQRGGI